MKLKIENLRVSFQNRTIIDNINLNVKEGEFVTILGPSGCGKSTILNTLTGIIKQQSGNIYIDNEIIKEGNSSFAYMPQEDMLFPWKNILDNVCLYGAVHHNLKEAKKRALENFDKFGLGGYENSYPDELSGGMRQRAAFLRTSLCDADIMLLDEPFGALDVITRYDMQDWLMNMRNELNKTTILVTHDIDEAIYLSDRILVLNGKPSHFEKEIIIKEEHRSREWLFGKSDLHKEIYNYLRER